MAKAEKSIFALLILLPALFLNFECFADEGKIRVGVVIGLTGAAEIWGLNAKRGLDLALDEINNSGGVKGQKIELLYEDSRTTPSGAVAAYKKLVNVDKVRFVVGDVWSFITNPLVPLLDADRVILISPTVMDASVERTSDYFFSMAHRVSSIRKAVEAFFKLNSEVRRIGILCWDDAYGRAHLQLWKEMAQANGVKVVDEICQSDFGNDYRSDITRIASKQVDAIIATRDLDRVLRRMKEQHLQLKLLSTNDIVESVRVRGLSNELSEGVYFTDWQADSGFANRFKARYGQAPMLEAENSYEVLRSIAKALAVSDGDELQALKGIRYDGVGGLVDFTRSMFANYGEGHLYRVKSGSFELVE